MTNTLTLNYLTQYGACKEGIVFFERNGLEGFPLDRLHEVKGDYERYVYWLRGLPVLEFDQNGNKTSATWPDGRVYTYTYDQNGNMISATYPNGRVTTYTYDQNGNMTSETYPDGQVTTWTYSYKNGSLSEIKENGTIILQIPE